MSKILTNVIIMNDILSHKTVFYVQYVPTTCIFFTGINIFNILYNIFKSSFCTKHPIYQYVQCYSRKLRSMPVISFTEALLSCIG